MGVFVCKSKHIFLIALIGLDVCHNHSLRRIYSTKGEQEPQRWQLALICITHRKKGVHIIITPGIRLIAKWRVCVCLTLLLALENSHRGGNTTRARRVEIIPTTPGQISFSLSLWYALAQVRCWARMWLTRVRISRNIAHKKKKKWKIYNAQLVTRSIFTLKNVTSSFLLYTIGSLASAYLQIFIYLPHKIFIYLIKFLFISQNSYSLPKIFIHLSKFLFIFQNSYSTLKISFYLW